VQDLEQWPYPQRQIVPMTETVHERFSVEIFRGCTRGCRFCQAGMITRPVRERRPETVQRLVEQGVADTGFEEVGLLSLSSADHSASPPIARSARRHLRGDRDLAVAALHAGRRVQRDAVQRADAQRPPLGPHLRAGGGQRAHACRHQQDGQRGGPAAHRGGRVLQGWRHVKLYFMVGLPTETDEDVLAIADLGIAVYRIARSHGKANKVTLSVGGFVPKPHTPFQWAPQDPPEEIQRKLSMIRQRIKGHDGIKVRTNDPEEGVIEGLLARGDRRVAPVVERAWQLGARFDGWHEVPTLPLWRRALEETGVDLAWYSYRERGVDEGLPWDHLDSGLEKSWLWEDWQESLVAEQLDDCRWSPCYDCGVCPGLDLVHDTGYQPGALLPVVPSAPADLGGAAAVAAALPTAAERYAAQGGRA
jgi:hypothetical protein